MFYVLNVKMHTAEKMGSSLKQPLELEESAVIHHVIILISIRAQTIKKIKNVNHFLYKTCLEQHIVFSFVTVCEHSNAPFHRHNYKARAVIDDG